MIEQRNCAVGSRPEALHVYFTIDTRSRPMKDSTLDPSALNEGSFLSACSTFSSLVQAVIPTNCVPLASWVMVESSSCFLEGGTKVLVLITSRMRPSEDREYNTSWMEYSPTSMS